MTMNDVVNLIVSNGLAVIIVAYFIFKDYKTSMQQIDLMASINTLMGKVEAVLSAITKKLD